MNQSETIVFFFNDWLVDPSGVNCGGGETATLALAKQMALKGHRVVACAYLAGGDCSFDGVEFWDFGSAYNIASLLPRLRELPPYFAFSATLAHPFLFLGNEANCRSKIVINHSPGPLSSGIELRTVMQNIDRFVCVSEAQKQRMLLSKGVEDRNIEVVHNGFDPKVFPYKGPEERDFRQLVFIGRVEPAKGADHAIVAFANLLENFPGLKLSVYGDKKASPEFSTLVDDWERKLPGLKFHGRVSQAELSNALGKAGVLLFPSISFESAGLAVLDAQACGCPVIAYDIGGVSEYLDPSCGVLVQELENIRLIEALAGLLSNEALLRQMSTNCTKTRTKTWEGVAVKLLSLAREVSKDRKAY